MAIIQVKVTPRAAANSIQGWQGDVLRIRLHAIPEKGSANEELIEFLSKFLDIPKSKIRILSGRTGRLKRIEIEGKTGEEIKSLTNFETL